MDISLIHAITRKYSSSSDSDEDDYYMSHMDLTTSYSTLSVTENYTGPVTRRCKRVSFNEVVEVKNVGKIYTTARIRKNSFYTAAEVDSFNYDAYRERRFKRV